MPRVSSYGSYNKWVLLSRSPQVPGDSDGIFEDLVPSGMWASIKPQLSANGRTTEHLVEMRYHEQVSVDTRIVYEDPNKPAGKTTRELFVRAVQNLDERGDVIRMICEEIEP